MFLYEECRRILQRSNEILIDAPAIDDDEVRAVDVLSFSRNKADADTPANEAEANSDGQNSDADSGVALSGRSSIPQARMRRQILRTVLHNLPQMFRTVLHNLPQMLRTVLHNLPQMLSPTQPQIV